MDSELVGVAEMKLVHNPGSLMCIGLGSCMGIVIYDPAKRIAGMAHAMLPRYEEGRDKGNLSKYVDTAVYLLVDELKEMGSARYDLRAKAAGGAHMFAFGCADSLNIGLRNAEVCRETLEKERIKLVSEDVGGSRGRTVTFDPATGLMKVQIGSEVYII
ncbi:MAG TPA: chemotaxis protein CheD [Methanomassiliicoccales archaeon]|nr:chemotaxis protein CheD [Methanomassiliicoccales archaeon]